MGNLSQKLKRRKFRQANLVLQSPEARGFLTEISKRLTYEEAVSKLSTAMHYLRQVDEFACLDVQKLLSFLGTFPCPHKDKDWIFELCKEHTMEFCFQSWQQLFSKRLFSAKHENLAKGFRLLVGILCTCTEMSSTACQQLCQNSGLKIILKSLNSVYLNMECLHKDSFNANRLYIAHSSLCILRNALAVCPLAKYQFRDSDGLEICRRLLSSKIDILKCEAFSCLAFSLNEHENHVVMGEERPLNFSYMIKILNESISARKSWFMSICPILTLIKAMNRLAANDTNKIHLGNLGILDVYAKIMRQWIGIDEVLEAVIGVWILAFDGRNREKIVGCRKLIESLVILTKAETHQIAMASQGAVWIIDNRLEREAKRVRQSFARHGICDAECLSDDSLRISITAPAPAPSLSDYLSSREELFISTGGENDSVFEWKGRNRSILISFEFSWKWLVEKIEWELKAAGFHVLMEKDDALSLDVRIESMETCGIILLCLSDSYKSSPLCRSEAEYMRLLHLDCIPLQIEDRYQPDGWLGILLGSKSVLDMTNIDLITQNIPTLIALLDEFKPPCIPESQFSNTPRFSGPFLSSSDQPKLSQSMRRSKTLDARRSVEEWSPNQVQLWLDKVGLGDLRAYFGHFDGVTLTALQKMSVRAPAVYYCCMKNDFQIHDMLTLLKFTNALEMLQ